MKRNFSSLKHWFSHKDTHSELLSMLYGIAYVGVFMTLVCLFEKTVFIGFSKYSWLACGFCLGSIYCTVVVPIIIICVKSFLLFVLKLTKRVFR